MSLIYMAGWDHSNIGSATLSTTGVVESITMSSGQYAHVTMSPVYSSGYTAFAAALQTELGAGWTVSYAVATGYYTISHASSWSLSAINTVMARILGIDRSLPHAATLSGGNYIITSNQTPWYYLTPTIPFRTSVRYDYEEGDNAFDSRADDGNKVGITRTRFPRFHNWNHFETSKSKVYDLASNTAWSNVSDTRSWTFEHLFVHARNVEPLMIYDSENGVGTDDLICKLTADGCNFRPDPVSEDFDEQWIVPFRTDLVRSSSTGVSRV